MVDQFFLVTYSQVDYVLCKNKEDFARLMTKEFKESVVEQWACSEEKHKDGGSHYHLCIKLHRIKRWKLLRPNVFKSNITPVLTLVIITPIIIAPTNTSAKNTTV